MGRGYSHGFVDRRRPGRLPPGDHCEQLRALFPQLRYLGVETCDCEANASFEGAIFSANADFGSATFSADTNFSNSPFSADACFSNSIFKSYVSFASVRYLDKQSHLDFQSTRIEKPERVSFHTLDLKPHWFINCDCRKFEFTDCNWNHNLKQELEGAIKARISAPLRLVSSRKRVNRPLSFMRA